MDGQPISSFMNHGATQKSNCEMKDRHQSYGERVRSICIYIVTKMLREVQSQIITPSHKIRYL